MITCLKCRNCKTAERATRIKCTCGHWERNSIILGSRERIGRPLARREIFRKAKTCPAFDDMTKEGGMSA